MSAFYARPKLKGRTMHAKDLRIGQTYGRDGEGNPAQIRSINELCIIRRTPHMHVITTGGVHCLPFNRLVEGFKKRTRR